MSKTFPNRQIVWLLGVILISGLNAGTAQAEMKANWGSPLELKCPDGAESKGMFDVLNVIDHVSLRNDRQIGKAFQATYDAKNELYQTARVKPAVKAPQSLNQRAF